MGARSDVFCSRRVEKQIKDLQDESEKKRMEVSCVGVLWAVLAEQAQVYQLQTSMQQQQVEPAA